MLYLHTKTAFSSNNSIQRIIYSPFGEVAVEIDTVIAGAVIVLMANTAAISIIRATVPNLLSFFF